MFICLSNARQILHPFATLLIIYFRYSRVKDILQHNYYASGSRVMKAFQLHLLHTTTHFNVITIPITTHYNYRSLVCCVMLQTRSHWTWHPPSVIDWWATKANDLHVLLNNISLAIRQSLCNVWLQPNFDF